VLSKGKLQIEVLNNLDKVAPVGALLFAAWSNIEQATGLPVRVLAITPKKQSDKREKSLAGLVYSSKTLFSLRMLIINIGKVMTRTKTDTLR